MRVTFCSILVSLVLVAASAVDESPYDLHLHGVEAVRSAEPGQVVVLGDSIAYDLARVSHRINVGIPGDTTTGVLWRLRHGATPAAGTAVVLIVGTNDAIHGRSPEDIEAGVLAIVDHLTDAGCGVLVVDEIPRGADGVHPDLDGYRVLATVAGL